MHTIIPILILVSLIGTVLWYVGSLRADKQILQANIKTLETNVGRLDGVIETQNESLQKVIALREADSKVLKELATSQTELADKFNKNIKARSKLESQNVQVKSFLDQPLPDDLRGLLNSQNSKYGSGNKDSGAEAAEPATK